VALPTALVARNARGSNAETALLEELAHEFRSAAKCADGVAHATEPSAGESATGKAVLWIKSSLLQVLKEFDGHRTCRSLRVCRVFDASLTDLALRELNDYLILHGLIVD